MSRPLVVIDVVGLTHDMIGPRTPCIARLAQQGFARPVRPVLPAVTCTSQATILTGELPNQHGIVANGWYFRDLAEVWLWRQSNRLMRGQRLYEACKQRDPGHTTAKMFWWFNMYAPVDWSMTPRPCYAANGLKVFDSYSQPDDLRDALQARLGVFPLQHFWGPGASIESTRWIVDATLAVMQEHKPALTLVYLPHLDYNLQRLGPADARIDDDIRAVDAQAGRLIDAALAGGARVVVLSEYAITQARQPVHVNRVLREHGYLKTRREPLGWETLDCGASRAFAVADHQVAHVYVRAPGDVAPVAALLRRTAGIDQVLDASSQTEFGLNHERSGELVAISAPEAWFTYYFWLDDARAPDYARTVDIHRKPGYDPVELFVDPKLPFPRLKLAWRLTQKKLGFRYLMDVIGLDAGVVRGSHGRLPAPGREEREGAVFVCSSREIERDRICMTQIKQLLLQLQFGQDDSQDADAT